jgi:hypothetical protein
MTACGRSGNDLQQSVSGQLAQFPDDGFGVQRRDGPRVDDLRVDALLGDPLVLGDEDLDELIAGFEEYRESPDE